MRIAMTLALLLALLTSVSAQETVVTLITHDSFAIGEDVLAEFTESTGIQVEILQSGDAGEMLNKAILSRGNPLGDVLFGVDNSFLSRALSNDIFLPYESPLLEQVPQQFQMDDQFRVTPIDYGDVCLNYDVAWFDEQELALPESLSDLAEPEYRGLLVVENPATSSPGLSFMLATIGVFGTEGETTWLDFWSQLVENEVRVVSGWELAYWGEFSHSGGEYPLVVSYASSPPAEVFFMEDTPERAPTGAIVADQTCFRQIEFAGILDGSEQVEAAQQLIDFMLDTRFQEDIPLQMFVFPVNQEAELPDVFVEYAQVAEVPAVVSPEDIDAMRETWIQAWTETVLRGG
ncbi:MAG: thiamine ABC transporter substrate-binding protein [Anaerolineaceae bacterium]|nr:thiamine ABC transporter substrate-binding protein [Anaerolineaceae bacterium]